MTSLAAMADDAASTSAARSAPEPREPGAPIAKDEIDPELVNLRKAPPRIGAITAAGVAILCGYLVVRLWPDLAFAREADTPARSTVAALSDNAFVEVPLQIHRAQAVRLRQAQGGIGLRAVPVAGSSDALWVLMTGDGWAPAVPNAAYAGRIRDLDALPLADALRDHVAAHPGPSFATLPDARAAFASGTLTTVGGDQVKVAPSDKVEIDTPVPDASVIIVTYNKRLPGLSVWVEALKAAGITLAGEPRDVTDETARVDVKDGVTAATDKLNKAGLYARIEPVRTTLSTTWGELAKAGAGPITIDGAAVDNARIDLIRVFAKRHVPGSARVLVIGEVPDDYWYVLPLVIGLGLLGAIAIWALARAIKRDYLAPRAHTPAPATT
jgi:hypothetical protein